MSYSHISLKSPLIGKVVLSKGFSRVVSTITQDNKSINRFTHSETLKNKSKVISDYWKQKGKTSDVPVFLKIDPLEIDIDFLRASFAFEIIAEQEDGYVLIVSKDINLNQFIVKVDGLGGQSGILYGSKNVAKVYELFDDDKRISSILKGLGISGVGNIIENKIYSCNISIAVSTTEPMPKITDLKNKKETHGEDFANTRRNNKLNSYNAILDEVRINRENLLETIVATHGGEIMGSYIDGKFMELYDSFTGKIKVNGIGLKDLLYNHSYIFEITNETKIKIDDNTQSNNSICSIKVNLLPPADNAPRIVVIDSGIEEQHPYLRLSIERSICYIDGKTEDDTADEVNDGGHGTRVAGAILYGNEIPKSGNYELPCYIQNARILDEYNGNHSSEPRQIYKKIVKDFSIDPQMKAKIYNSSVNNFEPCPNAIYMDDWSVMLDELTYHNDILFVQSIGNLFKDNIETKLRSGQCYPAYLFDDDARLTNPANSFHSIVVGSISHTSFDDGIKKTLAQKDLISSFSRTGPGLWDVIKPDVVAYGGEYLVDSGNILSLDGNSATELVRMTPPLTSQDAIGTSFSAPKVTNILAKIQSLYPTQSALLYRALLVASAKRPIPNETNKDSTFKSIGFGAVNLEDAIYSNDYKITLFSDQARHINGGEIHVYEVPIPEALINDAYDIKLDITLSYKARPRKTRRILRQYLSTRVDRKVSNLGENPEDFLARSVVGYEQIDDKNDLGMSWFLGKSKGNKTTFSRNKGSIQRDRTTLKSDKLRNKFCIGVVGHNGRDTTRQFPAEYSLVISFEIVGKETPIYTQIQTEIQTEIESEIQIGINDEMS